MPAVIENTVATEVPGPLSKAASKQLDAVFDSRAVHFVVDYDKSEGNQYVPPIDWNQMT